MPSLIRRNRSLIFGTYGVLSALLFVAFLSDGRITAAVNHVHAGRRGDVFFLFFEQHVNFVLLSACIALYLAGLFLARLKEIRFVAMAALVTYAVSVSSVQALKAATQRQRPFNASYELGIRKVTGAGDRKDSFPSGHAAAAFALIFPFALYWKRPLIKASLLLLGGLMGYSRMYVGAHFLSDVSVGAMLSMTLAIPVYWLCEKHPKGKGFSGELLIGLEAFLLMALVMHRPYALAGLPAGEAVEGAFSLHLPLARVLFEPLFGPAAYFNLSDNITQQQVNWLIWIGLAAFFLAGKKIKALFFSLACAACLQAIFFCGRLPAHTLVSKDRDVLLIDFHTHTNASYAWQWSAPAMIRQHIRSGFHGAFVTDYNTVLGAHRAAEAATKRYPGFLALPGQEYKGEKLHLLLLGIEEDISPAKYSVPEAIARTHAQNGVVIVPHYFRMGHTDYSVAELAELGVDGFEIANRTQPFARFQEELIDEMRETCRREGLLMVGGTDNHGLQSATYVWNAVSLSGLGETGPEQVKSSIMDILRRHDTSKITVVTLQNDEYHGWLRRAIDPPFSVFYYFRTLRPVQWLSWVMWVSLFLGILRFRRKH